MKFPSHFLFGSATSAHQIEGGNTNSDWYKFELIPGHIRNGDTSLVACNSWHKYKEDIELLKKSNQNAYRFSVEWAKIEPEENRWDKKAIEHYRDELQLLKNNHISPMVTLFHFTLPKWVAKKDGFTNSANIKYFVRFCTKMVEECGDLVDLWATLNEPNVYVLKGYIEGLWCPGEKNRLKAFKCWCNFIKAHNQAYTAMHKIKSDIKIGPVISTMAFAPARNKTLDKIVVWIARQFSYELMFRFMIKHSDWIGLNYYIKTTMQAKKPLIAPDDSEKNDYGWYVHPEGIYQTIKENSKWGKPIYITENGLADDDDSHRPTFLEDTFKWLEKALQDELPLRGYFHWSLLDNFEWASGYQMKFGLHTIDRKPRPSAKKYSELIKQYSA